MTAVGARDCPALDVWNASDPYAVLILGDCRARTSTKPVTVNPNWNQTFTLYVKVGLDLDPFLFLARSFCLWCKRLKYLLSCAIKVLKENGASPRRSPEVGLATECLSSSTKVASSVPLPLMSTQARYVVFSIPSHIVA